MSSFIGPALPPHLQQKLESPGEISESQEKTAQSDTEFCSEVDNAKAIIGPALPPHLIHKENDSSVSSTEFGTKYGKSSSTDSLECLHEHKSKTLEKCVNAEISSHFKKQEITSESANVTSRFTKFTPSAKEDIDEDDPSVLVLDADISDEESYRDEPSDDIYGPALPPGLRAGSSKSGMGPCLPPGMQVGESVEDEEEDDDDIVGPMPAQKEADGASYVQDQLNSRAMRMKQKLAGKDKSDVGPMKRESWMLELPPDRAAEFGLGPRQFRARERPDMSDRSVWTDTPADRLQKKGLSDKKQDAIGELELKAMEERDKEMQQVIEKHSSKKRKESLLEAHQKKIKKKKMKDKSEGKHEVRRPFDRDIDLQVNRFDEAQKKAIFKKAQLLNDRFSSGQSKYL